MFPLYDDNIRLRWPLLTGLLIALNLASWFLLQGFGMERPLAESICLHGLIPADLLGIAPAGHQVALGPTLVCVIDGKPGLLSVFSSMFMHGGWFHLIGNLWFLWVFGDNVEDVMGSFRFLVFYLVSGIGAAAAQVLTDPASTVPMVGASGAIGGVMGAYARMFPHARVHTLLVLGFYITRIPVPALLMLGYWFALQLLSGFMARGEAGVAFWAHVGGFAAGLLLSFVLVSPEKLRRHRMLQRSRSAQLFTP
jgi:membrane associated rhomboid family serine protease